MRQLEEVEVRVSPQKQLQKSGAQGISYAGKDTQDEGLSKKTGMVPVRDPITAVEISAGGRKVWWDQERKGLISAHGELVL
jgi:hypothetical protein